jgi:hypothetical protein
MAQVWTPASQKQSAAVTKILLRRLAYHSPPQLVAVSAMASRCVSVSVWVCATVAELLSASASV